MSQNIMAKIVAMDWFIADKASDTLKMLQEIRSIRTAVFSKNDFL